MSYQNREMNDQMKLMQDQSVFQKKKVEIYQQKLIEKPLEYTKPDYGAEKVQVKQKKADVRIDEMELDEKIRFLQGKLKGVLQ